jgi:hypothetical protein
MAPITDIRAYATLETDNLPRIIVRDSGNRIWIDSGQQVGTLSGTSQGACMIPYRPNASPQAWMYIAAAQDYKKYSAPDLITQAVLEQNVGIEEQHDAPGACANDFQYTDYQAFAGAYAHGGTAGPLTDTNRFTGTAGTIIRDPACKAGGSGQDVKSSIQLTTLSGIVIGMPLHFSTGVDATVLEIFPQINSGVALAIKSIFYTSGGTTGNCVIVPTQSPVSEAFQITGPSPSPYSTDPLGTLTRGSLVLLTGAAGTEYVFVLSVAIGPNGTICFEASTVKHFAAGETITGVPAISCTSIDTNSIGATITCRDLTYFQTGAGIGTVEQLLLGSPFNFISSDGTSVTQQFDYLGLSINISDLERLVAATFIWNVNPTVDFAQDGFYYQVDASQLVAHPPIQTQVEALFAQFNAGLINLAQLTTQVNAISIMPSSQYTTLLVPITSLKRFGSNIGLTLSDCNGFRVQIETTGSVGVRLGPQTIGIGHQPDIGPTGSQYFYRVRTRSSLTGATSNPSPSTRYGVTARRQSVHITMQDTVLDSQADTWDIFRMGGAVTTFRYIGSTHNTGGADAFEDNYFDTAALGGSVLDFDNFQPWPTIDVPFNVTAGGGGGVTIDITVVGTVVMLRYYSGSAFADPTPATILRWLPGTLITFDDLNAYTLWDRPTRLTLASPPAAHYYAYVFRLVENAGTAGPFTLSVKEPLVANQDLPYLWGPDAYGTVFGAGDVYRPGNVYFCKPFTPDSAPDTFNQEITNPSEPLMGGEILNGLALVASTMRWWALYPNFGSGNRYQAVEAPVQRGLIAPYAHATDGRVVYFWAKDGIWTTLGQNLTGADLHNIFPHEGVAGADYIYAGHTVYAPDYRYASAFRLCYHNGYLYADYRDSERRARTLVCDLRDPSNPAWCVDEYADAIGVHYAIEQQSGTVLTTATTYLALITGDDLGKVYFQEDLDNDNGVPINGAVATFEWNGGDVRSNELYNDQFIDLIPAAIAGVNATILEGGIAAQPVFVIPPATTRQHTNVPIGLELSYMGVLLEWTDDFDIQDQPTLLRSWQPMFQSVPVSVNLWKNQGTSFGLPGYKHIPYLLLAYKSTMPVTLTITVYDGTAPAVVTLPSTSGAYRKTLFWLTFNKGLLYFIMARCDDAEFQMYLSDCEIPVGAWQREEPYLRVRDIAAAIGIGEG